MSQYIGCGSTIGYAIYGAGGQTIYKRNNPVASGAIFGNNTKISKKLGLELRQILSAFSYSYAFEACRSSHSVGAALVWGIQSLQVKGLYGFDTPLLSEVPGRVTNNGNCWSTGVGARFGYVGKFCDRFTLGASYTTRISMSKLRKYEGIVTNRGQLDIPANVAVGITYDYRPCTRIGFEWQRIFYSACPLWHNSFRNLTAAGGTKRAGQQGGPGFGWDDLDAYKVGMDHILNDCWTVRAGYVHTPVPYDKRQLDVNILTQNLGGNHLTLGATYKLTECSEIDVSYFHMFHRQYSGKSSLLSQGQQTLTQSMYQDSIEFNYGYRY
jgi:long-chain fatty acid transport protein